MAIADDWTIDYDVQLTDAGSNIRTVVEDVTITQDITNLGSSLTQIAIELLANYAEFRPDDLRRIIESDFDDRNNIVIVRNPTKKKDQVSAAGRWISQPRFPPVR